MLSYCQLSVFVIVLVIMAVNNVRSDEVQFDVNYDVTWGNDHVSIIDQGREVQLSMDSNSGSGFGSKLIYGSGFFHMRIKLPNKNTAGVVTAFYLSSNTGNHDEVDFEFLGNKEGKPIILQTNLFANGQLGNREQRIRLWFDPTQDFHTYVILWNQHQIVFYVDDIPIRVFKNYTDIGVPYPTQPMQILSSIWDGSDWATDGGRTKVDWAFAPFMAHFQDFNVVACPLSSSENRENCYASNYWWNDKKYWKLSRNQQEEYERVMTQYLNYDYCDDRERFPTTPPECP
ncbi:xyloglucan endotransglucosylase/hydrolase [Striga asiatica]|uniref:Xyloglucan endotransglucosylase/hydrolase n=1 Tax=Striga asiatica TaxID=4170 RepID=A0A5A7QZV5_STRAF|nr:xyloglucan endotransglucosylase/hydrolase [Striga asiatica]